MENWKDITIPNNVREFLKRLDAQKVRLDSYRPIPPYKIKSIKESLDLEWTYNSNSIEGNTLTLMETLVVVKDGLTIAGKTLQEHFEAVNHTEAIQFVEALVQPQYTLHKRDILEVHSLVLDKIAKDISGRYRTGDVRIQGANFIPPDALIIDELMDDLISWYNTEGQKLHPIIRVSVFHHRFVWIHPFFDGNGRTARLIFNLLLMSTGFPPAIILKVDRKKYYNSLNASNLGDYHKFFLLVAQAAERSLSLYLGGLESRLNEYKSINDIVSEPGVPYGQEYVSLLARRGKIEAYKEGRVWYTSKDAIETYRDGQERKR